MNIQNCISKEPLMDGENKNEQRNGKTKDCNKKHLVQYDEQCESQWYNAFWLRWNVPSIFTKSCNKNWLWHKTDPFSFLVGKLYKTQKSDKLIWYRKKTVFET